MALEQFFFQKNTKNRPAAGNFAPILPIASSEWGLLPQTPVYEYLWNGWVKKSGVDTNIQQSPRSNLL